MDYKQQVANALAPALTDLSVEDIMAKIEQPKTSKQGDLAFPTFTLAKTLHKAPQMIAGDIVEKIDQTGFEKVVAMGPYVNFFLKKDAFAADVLQQVLTDGANFGDAKIGGQGQVPIDMSSPNIAKPISMGHLRSTVIGNSLANILSKIDYKPVKINHLGDWGTQFGKLITAYKMWGSEAEVKADPINNLLKYYVRFHKEDVDHPEMDDVARDWFKKLENGDEEAMHLWKWFRSESLKAFQQIYKRLDIDFDSFNGEAFYNDKMAEVVDILESKGLLQESQGAEVVDLSKYDLNPALIKKSDGATLYITRDLAAAIYRYRTYDFVQSLYVVGNEQSNHFKQLKAVLKEMGFDWSDQIHHIPFGLITQGGKKLSTRSGRVILLDKVLDDAVALAHKQIDEKNPDLANKDAVADAVGIGAVVFHDLKNERMNNFDFNLEEVVRFEGETGPYVQYAHARAESILRKAGNPDLAAAGQTLSDPAAWDTLKLLSEFPATVVRASEAYEPSVVAKYAIHLAKAFNKYYGNTKILVEDDELNARLALVKSVSIVLKEALRLLGVKAPDEM
ncbi:arginine--tRNA ligase [Lactiplantibacillus mudanjiangensis]|uniref:Arginine--tRNA ligase n=1 Tax=Lactiplantibacillus mudanjiangensis TaxID=1296538 RepID=A0A660E2U7_9LACO|nr:arginine--tRNA ligase [Lactiplantibacillus mudanjiangensis]VDG18404.1 arginyl-tRNA synthetase [Lactobacillus plantarum JDM1] [Lactiplantibacillus mudanjiangensis]VDG25059.1 arginyl-tRNA synthetase [Lactobacillus plantarum JDM1] [Lactiplantibacillus mudanjiangensis]VDG29666.1 arginyl-tRNA synthetase [Lactobacillus plantarum JDM1] [Lactiplantibacillus mudanjiangensis]VDG33665.1 arginyl-tRNA synthetase [Lactobacillus plantarum JDM1] [Lactiplantibacillus mudanjiangensis]